MSPTRRPPGTVRERPPVAADERFAARARHDRRRRLLGRLRVLLVIALVGGLVWTVGFSSLLGVRSVVVTGTVRTTGAEVRAAAALTAGSPLVRLDGVAVRARVLAALPAVETVLVQRRWPGTVRLTVVERVAVAAAVGSGGMDLLDSEGVRFATEATAPTGLPVLTLPGGLDAQGSATTTKAALAVLDALPGVVRTLVTDVTVSPSAEVTLTLDAGRTVTWGPSTESPRKAAALAALVNSPATVFDVSAPGLVTTR